jgi:penicillin-binding protein 2
VPNYLDSIDSEWFNQRLTGVMVVILVTFAILLLRLFYLQIMQGSDYRRQSEINSIRLQDIDAPRGLIFDRHGTMLVDNRPSFDLFIVPKDARPIKQTLEKLSRLLHEPVDVLQTRLDKNKKHGAYTPVLLDEDIGRDTLASVEVHRYDLPGVVVKVSPKRHYLYHQHAVHMIGYMGEINAEELQREAYAECKSGDFIGKFGVEKSFEADLRGVRGGYQVEVNATGQVVRVLETVPAKAGRDITLTIDHELQETAEYLLQDLSGAVVAVDPDSGEVLAMASSPTFDPNDFIIGMTRDVWRGLISNPFRPLENKAIQAEYPPASTYKIIAAIGGLEEGVIDAETTHFCPGFYKYGNRVFRCWRRGGHGDVNVVKALKESCDVFFYQVGEALGVDRLAWYAKAHGLGTATGIPIDGEASGLIPTAAWKRKRLGVAWQGGETLSVAIGQGFNLVTPLQMAMLVAAVGNGGTRYKPIIVKSMQTGTNGERMVFEPKAVGQLPVSETTLALVRKGLWAVVNEPHGTAYVSRIKGVDFSGKTGTAQVVGLKENEGESENDEENIFFKDHAWFVAYAPSEKPRIAVAVLVEHGEHGSSAAAPVAREIVRKYLNLPEDKYSQKIRVEVEERRAAAIRALEEQAEKLKEEAAENDD